MKKFLIILLFLFICLLSYSQSIFVKVDKYDNGNKKELFTYVNEKLNGSYYFWNKTGFLSIKGEYCNDEKCKKWCFYDEFGILIKEIFYDNGKIIKIINYETYN